jgi:hypothetical protein
MSPGYEHVDWKLLKRTDPIAGGSRLHGLLQPGRFFWARALPWSVVLGIALWIAYKFVKGVDIGLGLGGTGVPTTLGVLAALALYALSVRLIEQRRADELAVARLAPELATGIAFGAALFLAIMGVLLAMGAYTMTGPTVASPWEPLGEASEGAVEELIFRGAIFRLLWTCFGIPWALGLSSALFGAMHLIKPGADLMAVLGVILRHSALSALCAEWPAVGIDRLSYWLELRRGLCVRRAGFRKRAWPELI